MSWQISAGKVGNFELLYFEYGKVCALWCKIGYINKMVENIIHCPDSVHKNISHGHNRVWVGGSSTWCLNRRNTIEKINFS